MGRHHRSVVEKHGSRGQLLDRRARRRADIRRDAQLHAGRARCQDRKAGESFGTKGVIDLAANLRWNERPELPHEGRVSNTSPPAIVGNVLIASMSMHTGAAPNLPGASINEQWPMNIPGDVVAYDTKTGKMLWRFNTIPRPGEEGAETWSK